MQNDDEGWYLKIEFLRQKREVRLAHELRSDAQSTQLFPNLCLSVDFLQLRHFQPLAALLLLLQLLDRFELSQTSATIPIPNNCATYFLVQVPDLLGNWVEDAAIGAGRRGHRPGSWRMRATPVHRYRYINRRPGCTFRRRSRSGEILLLAALALAPAFLCVPVAHGRR